MEEKFSLLNKTRSRLGLPFLIFKNKILGNKYNLSLVLISSKEMQKLNKKYRGKNKATNVLSFPLTKNSGEIFLCPAIIKKELEKFNLNFKELLFYLFIHGLLHLKGLDHGPRMEKLEKKYFGLLKT